VKYSTKIAADTIQFLGKAKETGNVVPMKDEKSDPYKSAFDDMPDDLPF
jgi:hypothetical protein